MSCILSNMWVPVSAKGKPSVQNVIKLKYFTNTNDIICMVLCSVRKKTCATTQKRKKSRFWKRKNVRNVRSFSDHSINSVWVSDQLFNGTSAHYRLFSAMESLITIAIKHIAKKRLLKISVKPKRSCELISKYGTLNFCCTFFFRNVS